MRHRSRNQRSNLRTAAPGGILAVCLLAGAVGAQPSSPAACEDAAPGLPELLGPGAVLLLGEMHGTNESPRFFAEAVCQALARDLGVTVGLEIPRDESARLDAYLASAGDAAAEAELLAGPIWRRKTQDGRSSLAMLELLRELRVLQAKDLPLHIVLIDDPSQPARRDVAMAQSVETAVAARPEDLVLVLTGNIHNRLTRGMPWDETYTPMGLLLRQALTGRGVVSLNVAHRGGEAWLCLSGEPCAVQRIGGRAERDEGVVLFEEPRGDGSEERPYDGVYNVGKLTASRPAVTPPLEDG